jgi:hypothetical protein
MPQCLAFLLFLCGTAAAGDLNRIAIHYHYADGDFPAVIRSIEEFARTRPAWSREDSAFIAKHLGVVYAASPETRERGKYHLLRLLELEPGDDLADMYVSDEIHDLYQRLRRENEAHLRELAARREAERPARAPIWRRPWFWATAAGALAAGVTAAILWNPGSERPEYVVP